MSLFSYCVFTTIPMGPNPCSPCRYSLWLLKVVSNHHWIYSWWFNWLNFNQWLKYLRVPCAASSAIVNNGMYTNKGDTLPNINQSRKLRFNFDLDFWSIRYTGIYGKFIGTLHQPCRWFAGSRMIIKAVASAI